MHKIMKASIAGVAALTIAASGGTYALWSDYKVDAANTSGADRLAIEVEGGTTKFDKLDLAPGEKADYESVITGRVGGADINVANAYMTFERLTDADNGCGSQTEMDEDACEEQTTGGGEFSGAAIVTVNRTDYVDGACDGDTLKRVVIHGTKTLADLKDVKLSLGEMADGQQYCVKMAIQLPGEAGNVVQTDSSSFDIRYDLEQVPNTPAA